MKTIVLFCCLGLCGWLVAAPAPLAPERVAILYNSAVPESLELAKTYQKARGIPEANMIGLAMPDREEISRQEYEQSLRNPLRAEFSQREWWKLGRADETTTVAVESKIQVLVCMRGVPLKVARMAEPKKEPEKKPDPAQPAPPVNPLEVANEASVDSELAVLSWEGQPILGPLRNGYFESTQGFSEAKIPYIMLVGRIDGPSLAICQRMIADAQAAEKSGLWGRAYIDLAQFYPEGETWIRGAGMKCADAGMPVVTHPWKEVFPKHYPMTDAAVYYGWYEGNVCGPFVKPGFQLRRGSVAVHLHSFSASTVRSESANWCGPLLARGAAVTLGNVYEPYLGLTHRFDMVHQRLLDGFSWIEATYASIPVLSWQGVVLGDPLYRPFLHLGGTGEKMPEDRSYRALRVAKVLHEGQDGKMLAEIERIGREKKNPVLLETLGLIHLQRKLEAQALRFFVEAKPLYTDAADRLRCDLHVIGMDRDGGRIGMAVKNLRDAELLYAEIPEVEALRSLRAILDPPTPPPVQAPKK
jgi:uncharacterized protein (TIGR03790 family)